MSMKLSPLKAGFFVGAVEWRLPLPPNCKLCACHNIGKDIACHN